MALIPSRRPVEERACKPWILTILIPAGSPPAHLVMLFRFLFRVEELKLSMTLFFPRRVEAAFVQWDEAGGGCVSEEGSDHLRQIVPPREL